MAGARALKNNNCPHVLGLTVTCPTIEPTQCWHNMTVMAHRYGILMRIQWFTSFWSSFPVWSCFHSTNLGLSEKFWKLDTYPEKNIVVDSVWSSFSPQTCQTPFTFLQFPSITLGPAFWPASIKKSVGYPWRSMAMRQGTNGEIQPQIGEIDEV